MKGRMQISSVSDLMSSRYQVLKELIEGVHGAGEEIIRTIKAKEEKS